MVAGGGISIYIVVPLVSNFEYTTSLSAFARIYPFLFDTISLLLY
jgi:hypothetical protein